MTASQVAEIWNRKAESPAVYDRFWFFPQITAHANVKVCGKALTGTANGLHARLEEIGPFGRAVSVGCGLASKELNLLSRKIVERFDLFDLADVRLAKAQRAYAEKNVSDRATFRCENAFARQPIGEYDLVYWNSSLHHMPKARAAVEWSWKALRPGGVFAMYEFIGPTRFQWSDRNLDYVRRFRAGLPERLGAGRGGQWTRRPSVADMVARDPSEAVDSSDIIPALRSSFNNAEITYIGGALYHFGLNGVYPKIGPDDGWVFDQALLVDDLLSDLGENHFAVAIARKSTATGVSAQANSARRRPR
jgi:SAM-dependent methyltransferase